MTKPLGYYMARIFHEGATEIEKLLIDLSTEDKLGLIEWLSHDIREDLQELNNLLADERELRRSSKPQ